jgi:hypothetical protein
MWIDGISVYDKKTGIDWKWQAMDGVITKTVLGEKSTGTNPTDRAKSGTRSMVANRHDMKMTKTILQSIVVNRPEPTTRAKQHMCVDKGDYINRKAIQYLLLVIQVAWRPFRAATSQTEAHL